jgi:hypothetical protein
LETVVGDTRFDLQDLPLGLEEDAGAMAEDVGAAPEADPEAEPEPEDEAPTKAAMGGPGNVYVLRRGRRVKDLRKNSKQRYG